MTLGQIIDREVERHRAFWANPSLWNLAGPWAMVVLLTIALVWARNADSSSAKNEASVIATVVGIDSSNHGCYRYAFSTNGVYYANCGFPQGGSLAVGDQVVVYYDLRDPSRNHLHEFKEEVDNEALLIRLVWMLGIAPTAIVLWRRHLHQRRTARSLL